MRFLYDRWIKTSVIAQISLLITCFHIEVGRCNIEHPYAGNYVNLPSSLVYLSRHPGYKGYQLPNDIKKHGAKWGTWVTFPQKIEAIQARVGHLKKPTDLFLSQDFLAIYKHPGRYTAHVLNYLSDSRYSLEQKEIALYAISNQGTIPIRGYYQLYKNGKISLDLLECILKITIVNHERFFHDAYTKVLKLNQVEISESTERLCDFLNKMLKELPNNTAISHNLKALLNHSLPESWYQKQMQLYGPLLHAYYRFQLPF